VGEERLVAATLILLEDVDLALEVGVGGGGTRLGEDHAADDILLLGATEQNADVLTSAALVEDLAEHLDTGNGGLLGLLVDTDDLDLFASLDDTALDTTGDNGATAGDGEDVLDRHKEGLVEIALRLRDVLVHGVHEVEIVGIHEKTQKTTVTGVEMFRKILDEGRAGENVGVLLRGTKKEDVVSGMVLSKPGSTTPHTDFEGQVYVLKKDEGGRHKPFFSHYSPQFYFRTTDVTGTVELPEGTEMVMPGDNTDMTVHLIHPVAMEDQLKFAIREGGRTVGAGRVTKIIK